MGMDMEKMVMARHHAEMYMYDNQLAQVFQQASQIFTAKAQSNYQMYLHHSGHNQSEQMPEMMMDSMTPMCPMMRHMMHEHELGEGSEVRRYQY